MEKVRFWESHEIKRIDRVKTGLQVKAKAYFFGSGSRMLDIMVRFYTFFALGIIQGIFKQGVV